ncbi:MAG TPA: sialidase family protein [Chloroflexota bacterium]
MVFALAGSAAAAAPYNNLLSRGRTEPSVAIDPSHPSTIVVGSNPDYNTNGNLPVAYYTSHNGGRTFRSGTVPLLAPYTTAADPSVAIDRGGTVFYAFLGQTPAFCSVGHSAILLSTSRDGGRTFGTPVVVDVNRADDKPFMAIEDVAGGQPHVFVTWTRFHDKGSDIWYARSSDGGRTFSRSVMLHTSLTDNFGSLPVVGPGGHVYAFWSTFPDRPLSATSPARILMRASSDDGRRFAPVHSAVGRFWTIPQMMEPGSLRSLTAPTASSDRDGTLYLAWAAATHDHGSGVVDVDIMLSRSRDAGHHWSKGTSVNDAHGGDRFMPALSVLPDHSVGIAYYDRRSGPGSLDVYAVRVSYTGSFHRTPNIRVNHASSPISDIYYIKPGSTCLASGRFLGDYHGTAASPDNSLCVSWADTQFHVYDETDLWLARVYFPAFATVRSRLVYAGSRTKT